MVGKDNVTYKVYSEAGGKQPDFARVKREFECFDEKNLNSMQCFG